MKPLQLSKPHAIVMVGIPGSGKSFFAEHFASTFGSPIVSYQKIGSSLFKKQQNNRSEHAAIKKVASIIMEELLKTNQTFIYDGTTDTVSERNSVVKAINASGYKPVLLWVQTESSAAKARATKRSKSGLYLSDDEFEAALSSFMPPSKAENPIVISGKHTYASQLKIVLKHLTQPRAEMIQENSSNKRVFDRKITIR